MANQEKPQNTNRDQKFNPRTTDVNKQGPREPLPVEKNPTQANDPDRSGKQRDNRKS